MAWLRSRRGAQRLGSAALALALTWSLGSWLAPQPARALTLVANPDTASVIHDRTLSVPAPGVLQNDVGLLGGTVILVTGPSHGSLVLRADGGYTYTPNARYVGGDAFTYKVRSLLLTSNTTTVSITVRNTAPVAVSNAYSGPARTTLSIPAPGVLSNDTDADGDTLTIFDFDTSGISGSVTLASNGGLVYSPGGGFSGTATLTYRVWDGIAISNTTTVSLTIAAAAPSPTPKPTSQPTVAPTPQPTLAPTPGPISSGSILPIPTSPLTLPIPTLSPTSALPTPSLGLDPGSTSSSPTPSSAPSFGLPSGPTAPGADGGGPASSGIDGGSSTGGGSSTRGGASGVASSGGAADGVSSSGATTVAIGPGALAIADDAGSAAGSVQVDLLLDGASLWFVPAAAIGGPGMLVILWILLQVGAGGIWLPAARRLRGEDRARGVAVRA